MNFFEQNRQQLIWRNHGETLIAEPWGEDSIRVRAALLREVKDPRVKKTMVSVTRVDTTSDLRYAKVFVSVYDKDQAKEVFQGPKAAAGFLRHELAERLSLRHTPELVWTEDHSITYGARILDILSTLDIPKDEDEPAPEDPDA